MKAMIKRRNYKKLLAVYRAIERYQAENRGVFPSFLDLICAGVSYSNGDLTHCFEGMEEMGMLVYVRKSARSSSLLPESQFSDEMKKYIEDHQ